MATRRPIVLVSGVQSELPVGDNIDGALYQGQQVVAGSGLVGGGLFTTNPRLDVALATNPSGLYFVGGNKLGLDGQSSSVQFVASGSGVINRTVESKLRDVVSVKDFGAKGDDSTNDTAAVQAALNHSAATGKTIFFPAGIYRCSALVVAPAVSESTVRLLGEGHTQFGASSRIKAITPLVGNKLLHLSQANTPGGTGYVNCEFNNIGFEANYDVPYLLYVDRSAGFQLQRCSFYKASNTAIFLGNNGGDSFGVNVSDIYILGQDLNWSATPTLIGLYTTGRYANINRVVTDGCRQAIYIAAADQCTVSNCHLEGVRQGIAFVTSGGGQHTWNGNWSLCYGNHVGSLPSTGFYVEGTGVGAANNCTFVGNRISGATTCFTFKNTEFHTLIGNQSTTSSTLASIDVSAGNRPFYLAGNFPATYTDVTGQADILSATPAGLSTTYTNYTSNKAFSVSPSALGGTTSYQYLLNDGNPSYQVGAELGFSFNFGNGLKVPTVSAYAGANGADIVFKPSYFNYTTSEILRLTAVAPAAALPGSDNTINLGSGSLRWATVYAGTGTINTSDEREKQDIETLSAAELRAALKIKGLIKKFRFIDAVQQKDEDARIHVGAVAQDIEQVFVSEGLDPAKYGLFCRDTWYELEGSRVDIAEGEELPSGAVMVERLGIRYEELLAFVVAAI